MVPLDGRPAFGSRPINVAQTNHGHSVTNLSAEKSDFYEQAHAKLEHLAAEVIAGWAHDSTASVKASEIEIIERFIVLHMFRRPSFMSATNETVDIDMGPLAGTEAGYQIRRDMMIAAVSFPALLGAPHKYLVGNESERWAEYRAQFARYEWSLQRYSEPSLIVGDSLVSMYGDKDADPSSEQWRRSYFGGGGLASALRVSLPLTPTLGLLLSRGGELKRLRAETLNRSTIFHADEMLMHHPRFQQNAPVAHRNMVALIDARANEQHLPR